MYKSSLNLKILVSHPGRQHAHQLCYALQEQGWLQKFITQLWYKPSHKLMGNVVKVFSKISPDFISKVRKRYFTDLHEDLVEIHPIPELVRLSLQRIFKPKYDFKWYYQVERAHDAYAARRIKQFNPDIFIGYEHGSLNTFKTAKKMGKITIMDLAQIHHNHIAELRERFPVMKEANLADDAFFEKTNRIKEERLKYVDYIFALSDMAKQGLIKAGIPEEKIYLTRLGFDPTNWKLRTQYAKTGTFKIIYVGAITEHKGIRMILEALKSLQLPDVTFTMVGTKTLGVDTLLKEYEGYYTCLPYMHHEELVNLYHASDVMVIPSYLDSWGMVVTESMACGTPVIVSENTGTCELVEQGGGFVVPSGDAKAVAEKLLHLYNNREQLEILGKKAHEIVQKYTWDNYHSRIIQVIEEIWKKERLN
jgi:glycosyltransferase involved in cell wall biosynthesis